jgi:hypothetical protein
MGVGCPCLALPGRESEREEREEGHHGSMLSKIKCWIQVKTDPGHTRRRVVLRMEALLRRTEEGEWRGAGAPAERRGT